MPLPRRTEIVLLAALFVACLAAHFFFATRAWTSTFLVGHEFRQAQTALIAEYIDRQNNFSLLYETPIVGKPWVSILLEVPLYQWTVVGLSRVTEWPHHVAARTVSLACFYATLPALFLLLGRIGVPPALRLLPLALVLTTPVYIFYSRAFLMDSMVLMFSAWFLLGFVRTMDRRSWPWLGLTIVTGTAAALIKSITLAVWLVPAAAYGFWILWREWRQGKSWRELLQTVAWGGATVIFALGALQWWISYTDPVKAAHASAYIFSSKNLSLDNWGLLDWRAVISPTTWRTLFERWSEALMTPWLIFGFLGLGLVAFAETRRRVAGLVALFLGAQALFPYAYAFQDYYFFACAAFLSGALGLIVVGALRSGWPRWACVLLLAVPVSGQFHSYWRGYRELQLSGGHGGYPYTLAIAELTPAESVIVVAGADWAAMIPLYSQRRALMIRTGLEGDAAYLTRAFADLADEDVSALVLVGPLKGHREVLMEAERAFNLDARQPTFSHDAADVYVNRVYADGVRNGIRRSRRYPGVVVPDDAPAEERASERIEIPASSAHTAFANVYPAPFRGRFQFGFDRAVIDVGEVLSAHPDCDLWIRAPGKSEEIEWVFGILSSAYEREGDRTNGVEFLVTVESSDGFERQIFHRLLDPANRPHDRGPQSVRIEYRSQPGDVVKFSTRSNGCLAYDWAYWVKIAVR